MHTRTSVAFLSIVVVALGACGGGGGPSDAPASVFDYLKASNAEALDGFGHATAISGDTLVVGAPGEDGSATGGPDDNSTSVAGAAYVYVRSGDMWVQQAILKASNAGVDDTFGSTVAISGDTIVVGARTEASSATGGEADNSLFWAGAVYVFTRVGTTWTQQAYLKAPNADSIDQFGWSLDISGDTLVVGSPFESSRVAEGPSDNLAGGSGAAYVFVRSGSAWSLQAFLKASNSQGGYQFAGALAISGDTIVVGSILESSSPTAGEADVSVSGAGAAYVFTRTGVTWSQQAFLKAPIADVFDGFGSAVDISGDTLVVAAGSEDSSAAGGTTDNSVEGAGAAYVFARSGTTWTQQAFLKAPNADVEDGFGHEVRIDGDMIVVSTVLEDSSAGAGESDNSMIDAGAAYVFTRSGAVWSQQSFLKAPNAGVDDAFGFSVAVGGGRVVVSARKEDSSATGGADDNSAEDAGAVFVTR